MMFRGGRKPPRRFHEDYPFRREHVPYYWRAVSFNDNQCAPFEKTFAVALPLLIRSR